MADPPELVRAREALAQYAAEEGVEEPLELTHTRAALAAAGRLNGGGGGDALGGASVRDAAADAELDELEAAGRAAWAARREGDPDWLPLDDSSNGGGDGPKPSHAAAAPQPPPAQQSARPPPRAGASLSPDDDDGVAVAAPRPYAGTAAAAAQQAAAPEAAAPRRRVVIEEIESDSDDESVDSASETEEAGATLIAQTQLIAPPHGSLADID